MKRKNAAEEDELVLRCLAAFIQAGTLDISLDHLAGTVGISKRMLVHYFGGREAIEERATSLLEDRLRAQFVPNTFPSKTSFQTALTTLWDRTTAPESRGVLLLLMDLSRRAWSGSARARAFYDEQQRLWVDLLLHFTPDRRVVEEVLLLFQGSVLAFLITGNRDEGRRALRKLAITARRTPRSRA